MKIKKTMKRFVADYLMIILLTAVVMFSIYQLGTLHFERLRAVYLMIIIFGVMTAGGSVWIVRLSQRVIELEEEVDLLKRF